MKLPNLSILLNFFNITNIYNWHPSEKNETFCLTYIIVSRLNSNFEISIKVFPIFSVSNRCKQSESSNTYKEIFIFFDINHSEPSFDDHGMFKKFDVNQSELSSTSHGFSNIFDIKQLSLTSQVIFVVITNQNEELADFKILCRSEPNYLYEISNSISFFWTFPT